MPAPRSFGNPKYIDGDWDASVSAAGSSSSDATTLPANHCWVDTVTSGQGVIIPAIAEGEVFSVANADSTEDLLVYPPSGASFNGATADAAITLPAASACWGRFVSPTKIIVVMT